jgi:hypothetical protein
MSHRAAHAIQRDHRFAELMYDSKAGPVSQRQREFLRDILTAASICSDPQ